MTWVTVPLPPMIQHFHSGGENYVEMVVVKSLLLIFHTFTRGIESLRMTLELSDTILTWHVQGTGFCP